MAHVVLPSKAIRTAPDEERRIRTNGVRSGYFQTMGLPPLLDRDFTPQEISSDPEKFAKVAIINETIDLKAERR